MEYYLDDLCMMEGNYDTKTSTILDVDEYPICYITGFPSCCGTDIVHMFEAFRPNFYQLEERLLEYLYRSRDDGRGIGSFIAVDNGTYQDLFVDSDWVEISSYINPNTGNRLVYWELSI